MNKFKIILSRQKAYFRTGETKSYQWRVDQLTRMEKMLVEHQQEFFVALNMDFKTALPEQVFEVHAPLGVINFTRASLAGWMEPEQVPIPKFLAGSGHSGVIHRDPYGSVLIIGPFNGPLITLLNPAIAALSAGNTVVLKTNENAPATGALLEKFVPLYFEAECVAVVSGGKEVVESLLQLPFDFIFFTGSSRVGKIVAKAAAEKLIPVILELGGQNPVIIDETADIKDAARKIAWGATAWGGQWCTSPGYAYVHRSVAPAFLAEMKNALREMYGKDPKANSDLSKMISGESVNRLMSLIDKRTIVTGGNFDAGHRYLEPTVLYPVQWDDAVMQEELFGPVLPVLEYDELDTVVNAIQTRPAPLAAFIFSKDQSNIDLLTNSLSFGGGAVNQTNIHLFIVTMPFGGVGDSGIGNYYGRHGYDSLTHAKSMLIAPSGVEIEHLLPPYTMEKIGELNKWFDY